MTEAEFDGMRRELQRLRARVEELAVARTGEIADLRHAIWALEQRLLPAPTLVGAAPPPFPPIVPDPPLPAFEPEVVAPAAAKEVLAPVEVVPPLSPAPAPEGSFELRFGRVWLVRLGIALLVTGLVLLGNYAYKNWIRDLPAGVRLAALYFGSLLISGSGLYLGARETMRRFGDVLLAGGLAFFYWCTFAAHHVPRLRVIESPVAAGVLLLGAAGLIVGVSLRRDSRVTALMGLLLASYSVVLQPLGWLSAASNVILAAAGTGLMLRPGWFTPGVASMAGSYAAFFWWQIAGGHGGRPDDPSALWFLPPVWALFALPGVIGISRKFSSLGERARTWFAAANNTAFFLLFSALWLGQRGGEDYWQVPAVFGAVLLVLGAVGRSRDATGGVHLAQGLAALTLALALKLKGYHLPLGFAVQALTLSLAFRRFAGKSELVFAIVAAALATTLSLGPESWSSDIPLWSRALVALLLMAAAFPLRDGCDRCDAGSDKARAARAATTLVLVAGSVLALVFCCDSLGENWRAPAVQGLALGFAAFTLLKDRERRLPEVAWMAVVFGVTCLGVLLHASGLVAWWSPALAGALALTGHGLWMRRAPDAAEATVDPLTSPQIFHWLTAITVAASTYHAVPLFKLPMPLEMTTIAVASLAIAAAGRFLIASPVLQVAAVLLLPQALNLQDHLRSADPGLFQFVPVIAALGMLPLASPRSLAGILARVAAVLSWLIAWSKLAPGPWGDIIAASALLLVAWSTWRKTAILPETWGLLAVAVAWLFVAVLEPWHPLSPAPFPHGWMVLGASFATLLMMKPANASEKNIRHGLLLAACALLAVWTTQLVVWHFDWKPVAILWTLLGFVLVSAGLWQKLSALRHAGFALLALSLGKLFAVDVWDFSTFNRVAAFLALGVALVVLGFFYNRFADVLKKLFESDAA